MNPQDKIKELATAISPEARECAAILLPYVRTPHSLVKQKREWLEGHLKTLEDKAKAPLVAELGLERDAKETAFEKINELKTEIIDLRKQVSSADAFSEKLEEENTRLKETLASLESIVKSKQKIINSNDDNLESWIEAAANKINALEESIRVKDEALKPFNIPKLIERLNDEHQCIDAIDDAIRLLEALSHNTGRKEATK